MSLLNYPMVIGTMLLDLHALLIMNYFYVYGIATFLTSWFYLSFHMHSRSFVTMGLLQFTYFRTIVFV